MFGKFDELNAGAVGDDVLIDVADTRVRDAAFDDHGLVAETQAKIVKGIELKRETGFHLHATVA
jgi:hypothetical protein